MKDRLAKKIQLISMSSKIFLPVIAVVIAGIVILFFLSNIMFTILIENDVEDNLIYIGDQAQWHIIDNADGSNLDELIGDIYELNRFSLYAEMVFFDINTDPLFSEYVGAENQFFLSDLADNIFLTSKDIVDGLLLHVEYQGNTYFAYFIAVNGDEFGDIAYIGLVKPMIIYDNILSTLFFTMLTAGLVIILASVFVLRRVTRYIVTPIENLEEFVQDIADNRFGEFVPSNFSPEIISLEQNIMQMSERLLVSRQEQKIFFHNASHELKTPLMIIRGYGEALQKDICADHKKAGSVITGESIRLGKIVKNMMTLGKLDSPELYTDKEEVILDEFIEDLFISMEGINERHLAVRGELESGIAINVNKELLKQALVNPLSNSFRYAESQILISLRSTDDNIEIDIENDGEPISDETLNKIFIRFAKGSGGQNGLGMSIMKAAVEKIGGSVEVINLANGVRFEIRIFR